MTVIAWDGKTLAADKRATNGTSISSITKIYCVDDFLVGISGGMSLGAHFLAWVKEGRKPDKFPGELKDKDDWVPALVIEPDGKILKYERTAYPMVIEDKFHAIGCGRDYAMAAMLLGKSAKEAVKVASQLDSSCGNGVDTLTFRKKK